MWSANLAVTTWASRPGRHRPLAIGPTCGGPAVRIRSSAGTVAGSHVRQASLLLTVRRTKTVAGSRSNCSITCSPMHGRTVPQWGHGLSVSARSWTVSRRSRWAGEGERLCSSRRGGWPGGRGVGLRRSERRPNRCRSRASSLPCNSAWSAGRSAWSVLDPAEDGDDQVGPDVGREADDGPTRKDQFDDRSRHRRRGDVNGDDGRRWSDGGRGREGPLPRVEGRGGHALGVAELGDRQTGPAEPVQPLGPLAAGTGRIGTSTREQQASASPSTELGTTPTLPHLSIT